MDVGSNGNRSIQSCLFSPPSFSLAIRSASFCLSFSAEANFSSSCSSWVIGALFLSVFVIWSVSFCFLVRCFGENLVFIPILYFWRVRCKFYDFESIFYRCLPSIPSIVRVAGGRASFANFLILPAKLRIRWLCCLQRLRSRVMPIHHRPIDLPFCSLLDVVFCCYREEFVIPVQSVMRLV